ncbi:hypothetical protein ABID82_007087 [Methylobacterium sp. PvP062]|uniref:Uncharacterized protein n=1 Tax=Methylobacterium radiotolerans TaxID=31998 RepID=A0ABV2N997_9HYPH|nr:MULTISPECIES: hypothetical protein [unclassified Methylobacterium]MBP2493695.1 hypothetical protein [Methylobacterium sp. PvP105]MBP2499932.1 hypothetical protein [Methylobacterium sp. PvP109]MCX7336182.1 hypothetical protein [Hyphomicrobiales bacterium]
MTVTRQQAIQLIYALMYGASDTARLRLDKTVPSRLAASVRRLLDEDVSQARASQSGQPTSTLAFYDELPSGTGHEVRYTPYRVFNLAVAHELTRFGCKQGEVVDLIAAIQDNLKGAFSRANDSLQTWGRTSSTETGEADPRSSPQKRRQQLKIFLVLRRVEATEHAVQYYGPSVEERERLNYIEIFDSSVKLAAFLSEELTGGLFGAFVIELSELAVRISELVQHAPVRKRGRQTSTPPANWGDVVAQFRVRDRDHE